MLDIRLVSIQDQIEGDDRSSVQRLQVAFGVDARIARFFLANIPIFVKRNASTEEARAYVQALHLIGAEVEIHRAQKNLTAASADRFQPDAMEKLRAAQQRQIDEGPDPFDERPDRFPDSVAPFMDEVPPAFPKSMDIREMTSPPGFDSRLGDDEMEQLLSYMPDDSSVGPLTMDLPDGRSLDAFEAFGIDEHEFDNLGDIDSMGNIDDEDFPEILGNAPPPAAEKPAALSAPIPFPDDLLDPVDSDVDPAAISRPTSAASFTTDLDVLLAGKPSPAASTLEENINDLFPDGVPGNGRAARTTQPELRAHGADAALPVIPPAWERDDGVPPPPAPPAPISRPARQALVPALPPQFDQLARPTHNAAPFSRGIIASFTAPFRGAGALWLAVLASICVVLGVIVALPVGGAVQWGLGLGMGAVLLGALARYFVDSADSGLEGESSAPALSLATRPGRPGLGGSLLAVSVLAAVVFAVPGWAAGQLVSATREATQASAPLTQWDEDQTWYDQDGKPLVIAAKDPARMAYDARGAKVLIDPQRKLIHHIDGGVAQQQDPDLPAGPLLFFMGALLLPLLYWPMALSVAGFSGSLFNAFNPIYVGAAIVKGGAAYAFVALVGLFGTAGTALVCASLVTPAIGGGSVLFVVAAVALFGLVVPYVHGVQGQLMGRLLADRREEFTHFGAL